MSAAVLYAIWRVIQYTAVRILRWLSGRLRGSMVVVTAVILKAFGWTQPCGSNHEWVQVVFFRMSQPVALVINTTLYGDQSISGACTDCR